MKIRIPLISLFLLSTSAHAAFDNQIITKDSTVSSILLAGRIGEAAMFSVQADDDDDLEIFATASSKIDTENDHWRLLDWDGANYQVIKTGKLQKADQEFLSGHQISYSEILLGHKNGLLSTISFTDDPDEDQHSISETQSLLSEYEHTVIANGEIDSDIKAIVSLTGTDQADYTVLCTEDYLHILDAAELKVTFDQGGYCQTGNLDYETIAPGIYDQELITASGIFLTFDGTQWIEKTNLNTDSFGDNFKVGNIDDDDADEILSQDNATQLQAFSPFGGSWVYISSIKNANRNFSLYDLNGDDLKEVIFDYIDEDADPKISYVETTAWDTDKDSHITTSKEVAPYPTTARFHFLPTTLNIDSAEDFFLFTSNEEAILPTQLVLSRYSLDLSTLQQSLLSTSKRSFSVLAKTNAGSTLSDFNLIQLEQMEVAEDTYKYAYKFFDSNTLAYTHFVEPTFNSNEMTSVDSLTSFNIDNDAGGIHELIAGGQATYLDPKGIVIASDLSGAEFDTLNTPTLESVSALFIADINKDGASTPDIIASGKNLGDDGGIAIHIYEDFTNEIETWFKPGSGATEFKSLIASNIKGDDKLELLGLHDELSSYNANAAAEESAFYNLGNLDLRQFTPISLDSREYQYALASNIAGSLYLIEPKDFDILASVNACNSELSGITSVRINNATDIAFAVCEQTLLSWVIKFDVDTEEYGYSLHALQSTELGNTDTSSAQFSSQITDDLKNHLFVTFKNKLMRFELNGNLASDDDNDGYFYYEDAFPNEVTQWEDADNDTYGDSPTGVNPDPSLNDFDNDGVPDTTDVDNTSDNGLPSFLSSVSTINKSASSALTTISLTAPTASDLFDGFNGNPVPTITANPFIYNAATDKFEKDLEPGTHIASWVAQDTAGNNSATLRQTINIYPTISFSETSSSTGESQTTNIVTVKLSGESPVYPFNVEVALNNSSTANDADFAQDLSSNITITFSDGDMEKSFPLTAIDDNSIEDTEVLNLDLANIYPADSFTIDSAVNSHTVTIKDQNVAPSATLSVVQNSSITTTPNNIDGAIDLNITTSDTNASDTHTYLWDLTNLGQGNPLIKDVSFNPSDITPGVYAVSLTITDNGLPAATKVETFMITIVYGDSDGDGALDNIDAFPNDPTEQSDRDGDKVGDKSDVFPDNANEHSDRDGDNVGDKSDVFPDNAKEQSDRDGDGVGDNSDLFPDDADEQLDTDGDGVGDNSDAFPKDPEESKDTDNDGLGDNADHFPADARETVDTDGDGVGDNLDEFPNDDTRSNEVEGQEVESGSLYYLWFLLLPLLIRRKVEQ